MASTRYGTPLRAPPPVPSRAPPSRPASRTGTARAQAQAPPTHDPVDERMDLTTRRCEILGRDAAEIVGVPLNRIKQYMTDNPKDTVCDFLYRALEVEQANGLPLTPRRVIGAITALFESYNSDEKSINVRIKSGNEPNVGDRVINSSNRNPLIVRRVDDGLLTLGIQDDNALPWRVMQPGQLVRFMKQREGAHSVDVLLENDRKAFYGSIDEDRATFTVEHGRVPPLYAIIEGDELQNNTIVTKIDGQVLTILPPARRSSPDAQARNACTFHAIAVAGNQLRVTKGVVPYVGSSVAGIMLGRGVAANVTAVDFDREANANVVTLDRNLVDHERVVREKQELPYREVSRHRDVRIPLEVDEGRNRAVARFMIVNNDYKTTEDSERKHESRSRSGVNGRTVVSARDAAVEFKSQRFASGVAKRYVPEAIDFYFTSREESKNDDFNAVLVESFDDSLNLHAFLALTGDKIGAARAIGDAVGRALSNIHGNRFVHGALDRDALRIRRLVDRDGSVAVSIVNWNHMVQDSDIERAMQYMPRNVEVSRKVLRVSDILAATLAVFSAVESDAERERERVARAFLERVIANYERSSVGIVLPDADAGALFPIKVRGITVADIDFTGREGLRAWVERERNRLNDAREIRRERATVTFVGDIVRGSPYVRVNMQGIDSEQKLAELFPVLHENAKLVHAAIPTDSFVVVTNKSLYGHLNMDPKQPNTLVVSKGGVHVGDELEHELLPPFKFNARMYRRDALVWINGTVPRIDNVIAVTRRADLDRERADFEGIARSRRATDTYGLFPGNTRVITVIQPPANDFYGSVTASGDIHVTSGQMPPIGAHVYGLLIADIKNQLPITVARVAGNTFTPNERLDIERTPTARFWFHDHGTKFIKASIQPHEEFTYIIVFSRGNARPPARAVLHHAIIGDCQISRNARNNDQVSLFTLNDNERIKSLVDGGKIQLNTELDFTFETTVILSKEATRRTDQTFECAAWAHRFNGEIRGLRGEDNLVIMTHQSRAPPVGRVIASSIFPSDGIATVQRVVPLQNSDNVIFYVDRQPNIHSRANVTNVDTSARTFDLEFVQGGDTPDIGAVLSLNTDPVVQLIVTRKNGPHKLTAELNDASMSDAAIASYVGRQVRIVVNSAPFCSNVGARVTSVVPHGHNLIASLDATPLTVPSHHGTKIGRGGEAVIRIVTPPNEVWITMSQPASATATGALIQIALARTKEFNYHIRQTEDPRQIAIEREGTQRRLQALISDASRLYKDNPQLQELDRLVRIYMSSRSTPNDKRLAIQRLENIMTRIDWSRAREARRIAEAEAQRVRHLGSARDHAAEARAEQKEAEARAEQKEAEARAEQKEAEARAERVRHAAATRAVNLPTSPPPTQRHRGDPPSPEELARTTDERFPGRRLFEDDERTRHVGTDPSGGSPQRIPRPHGSSEPPLRHDAETAAAAAAAAAPAAYATTSPWSSSDISSQKALGPSAPIQRNDDAERKAAIDGRAAAILHKPHLRDADIVTELTPRVKMHKTLSGPLPDNEESLLTYYNGKWHLVRVIFTAPQVNIFSLNYNLPEQAEYRFWKIPSDGRA